MTMTGLHPDGTRFNVCLIGAELFAAWLKSDWRDTPQGQDVFDNPEGREYWAHRDSCKECTKRKEIENGKG